MISPEAALSFVKLIKLEDDHMAAIRLTQLYAEAMSEGADIIVSKLNTKDND